MKPTAQPVFAFGAWGSEAKAGVIYSTASIGDLPNHNRVIVLDLIPANDHPRIYFDDRSEAVVSAARRIFTCKSSEEVAVVSAELKAALVAFDKEPTS